MTSRKMLPIRETCPNYIREDALYAHYGQKCKFTMARKVKQIRIPKKKSRSKLQQSLKQRLVMNPKKRRTTRRISTNQPGEGAVLGLL